MSILDRLTAGCAERNPHKIADLSRMTTMGIGTAVPLLIVEDKQDLVELRSLPHRWLGKGANTLICGSSDQRLTLKLGQCFNFCEYSEQEDRTLVRVGAAFDLARLVGQCAKRGLAGPEGLAGVPATIGGALAMNAGTASIWLFDCVHRVEVLFPQAEAPQWIERKTVPAGYRSSGLPAGTIFLSCELLLPHDNPEILQDRAKTLKQKKATTQPLAAKSAGCIFKNPTPTIPAGRLLDELGLKGSRVGDAVLSEVHGNFIVNAGAASSDNVCVLINQLRLKAWQERQQHLTLEVQTWDAPEYLFAHPRDL